MMEHMSQADWVGTPILGPLLERRAMEEDVSWTMHLTQGETEQEMRRRWLEYHLQAQRGRCAYCGVGIEIFRRDGNAELRATVDHIIPLSEGGPDRVENTLGACRRCNYAKRSMALEAFLVSPEFQESVRLNHPCPDRLCGDVVSPDFHLDLLRRGAANDPIMLTLRVRAPTRACSGATRTPIPGTSSTSIPCGSAPRWWSPPRAIACGWSTTTRAPSGASRLCWAWPSSAACC